MNEEQFMKEAEQVLLGVSTALKGELASIRGNRPTIDLIEHIPVTCYDNQNFTIQQLGSIGVSGPSELTVTVWDPQVIPEIVKAIESAKLGLSVSSASNTIRAALSSLGEERRDELTKTVKKMSEQYRIQIRTRRDDLMKRIKSAEDAGDLSEDRVFKLRARLQKVVDGANDAIEQAVEKKIAELS